MGARLEIALKRDLADAEGANIRRKAKDYFGLQVEDIRVIRVLTVDADLDANQLKLIRSRIFTNPVTEESSFSPMVQEFDWLIWVGLRPGVRDTAGSTAVEAVEDILNIKFGPDEAIYTSKRYCLKGKALSFENINTIAGELLANDIIQQWKIFSAHQWDPTTGTGIILPKVILDHTPSVTSVPVPSDSYLQRISDDRG